MASMKVGVECQKLKKSCSYTLKIISLFLVIFASETSSQNPFPRCPFRFFYQFGDGVTDIGNTIRILPSGPLRPATRPPYGRTTPGTPTGRWSDGLVDSDYTAAGVGLPNIAPYLSLDPSTSYNGVVYSSALSTVLNPLFFATRGVIVPPDTAPLDRQLTWFRNYLRSVCSNPTDCANRLANSIILFGDVEGNDIGYSLVQGKSIEEVRTYVPFIIQALVDAAREVIRMGATRIVYSANVPLGCYPYILTRLPSSDPSAYDELGCLRRVNELIISKNNDLQEAVNNLRTEFPSVTFLYADDYNVARSIINQTSVIGPGGNTALRACCGIGGRYNYDSRRFCGSPEVPVCPNPQQYIYWDGLHFTQEFHHRLVRALLQPALPLLNCTTQ